MDWLLGMFSFLDFNLLEDLYEELPLVGLALPEGEVELKRLLSAILAKEGLPHSSPLYAGFLWSEVGSDIPKLYLGFYQEAPYTKA